MSTERPDNDVSSQGGAHSRPRRRSSVVVASVAAAVLLAGGGGAYLATGASGGSGGCGGPVPLRDGNEAPCALSTVAPPPEPVTVDSAAFGPTAHFADGKQVLVPVPSWLFEVRPQGAGGSFTVTHPADPADPAVGPKHPTAPKPRDVTIEGYTVEGRDLTVSFWGGACGEYTASANEENDKVTVTVTEQPSSEVCILIAKGMERTVRLDKPLGDREVVGTDGKKIPEGSLTDLLPNDK